MATKATMRILWLTLALPACSLYFGEPNKTPRTDPDAGVITFDAFIPDDGCKGPLPDAADPYPDAADPYPDAADPYPDAAVSPDGGCEGAPDAALDVDAGEVWPDAK